MAPQERGFLGRPAYQRPRDLKASEDDVQQTEVVGYVGSHLRCCKELGAVSLVDLLGVLLSPLALAELRIERCGGVFVGDIANRRGGEGEWVLER